MAKLIGNKFEGEIEVKRLYIDGVEIESKCPKCGKIYKCPIGGDHLSYPTLNEPTKHYCYCEDCNTEWQEYFILEMTAKLAE